MLLKIIEAGAPVLRIPARPLAPGEIPDPWVQSVIELMRETMRDAPGVGLAAPQIGEGLRIAVVEDRAEYHQGVSAEDLQARGRKPIPFHVLINPVLQIVDSAPAIFPEGCLSVPGYTAEVPRASVVRVSALDHRGENVTVIAHDWYARILQHELDHLDGTLYVDRMNPRTLAVLRPGQRPARSPVVGQSER